MPRQYPRFLESFVWTQIQNVPTSTRGRFINPWIRMIAQEVLFHISPEVIHRIQFRCCSGQQPNLHVQLLGQSQTRPGSVLGSPILKEENMPPSPMGTNLPQK